MLAKQPLKRFIVFGTSQYYPAGGMEDAISSHDSHREALNWIVKSRKNLEWDDYHIFDCNHRIVDYLIPSKNRAEGRV